MYVACSTLSFARLPLQPALRLMAELEFSKVDVAICEQGSHLKPSEVVRDVAAAALRIRIGPSLTPAAFSAEFDVANDEEYVSQLRAICKLARMAAVPLISVPAAAKGVGLDVEAQRLRQLVQIVASEGLILAVPTRIGTLTELPSVTRELCERVPGLGVTLDPSAFINGPHQGGTYDEIFPYVKHVQLRDSGKSARKIPGSCRPGRNRVRPDHLAITAPSV